MNNVWLSASVVHSNISLFSKGSQAWMHLGQFCFLNNKWHYQYYFFGDCPYPVNIFTLLAVFVASKSRDCHTEGEKSYFLYLQQYQWTDIRNKTICASVRYLLYRIDENGWPTFSEDQRKKRMLTVSAPALATLIPAKWSHPCSLPFFLTVSVSVPPVTIDCIPSTIGECKYLVLNLSYNLKDFFLPPTYFSRASTCWASFSVL